MGCVRARVMFVPFVPVSPCPLLPHASCSLCRRSPGQKARNEAEKHRRDRINRGVNTICGMVGPAYLSKQQKKIDKITTLRLAANYMRRAFSEYPQGWECDLIRRHIDPSLAIAMVPTASALFSRKSCKYEV